VRASVSSESDDLFFDSLVRGYVEENQRFVRRGWLAEELDAKLNEPGKRFVLLTAEPGAGKSAFLAQLAKDHPEWLRYFIRRDQRSALADVSDKSLLLRIGYQLSARRPELFAEDQVRLSVSVEQHFGTVAEQAEAVGIRVSRLLASPFHQNVLKVVQHVQSNQGKVVGLQADELVAEPRLLAAEDLLFLALVSPARALARTDPGKQIVILIDALDEIRYHPGTENILAWLTNCPELPENLRFVLTSRPDNEALKLFRDKQADRLAKLEIAKDDRNVRQDVQTFVTKLIDEPAIAQVLQQTEGGAQAFAKKAIAKAHGNLGYLDALARGISQAIGRTDMQLLHELLALKELPLDLEGLYGFFLHQIKAAVVRERIELKDPKTEESYDKPVWPAVYDPILGVLAVAMEPVDLDLIIRLGGIRTERVWVSGALDRLMQFLDVVNGRYRFYHATVAEFLTAESTRDLSDRGDLYVNPSRWNTQVVDVLWRAREEKWSTLSGIEWKRVDDYGLLHLAAHLYALGGDRGKLYGLISRSYMLEKRSRFGSDRAFFADLGLALDAAAGEPRPNLVQEVRLSLIQATLGTAASEVPAEALGALVWAGETVRALDHIAIIQEDWPKLIAHELVCEALLAHGPPEQAAAEVRRGLEIVSKMSDEASARGWWLTHLTAAAVRTGEVPRLLEIIGDTDDAGLYIDALVELASAQIAAGLQSDANGVVEKLERMQGAAPENENIKARALAALSKVRLALGRPNEARQAAEKAANGDRATKALARALAREGNLDAAALDILEDGENAELAADALQDLQLVRATPGALAGRLALALARRGEKDRALELVDQILAYAASHVDNECLARALGNIATALASNGADDRSAGVAERALAALCGMNNGAAMGRVLPDLMPILVTTGRAAEALAALEQIADDGDRGRAQGELASALYAAGEAENSLRLAIAIQDAHARAWALRKAAETYARSGDFKRAARAAKHVLAAARKIGRADASDRRETRGAAVAALAWAGNGKAARAAAREIADEGEKASALAEMKKIEALTPAVAAGEAPAEAAGDEERASVPAEPAEATEDVAADDVSRVNDIAEDLFAAGDTARATELAKRALAIAVANAPRVIEGSGRTSTWTINPALPLIDVARSSLHAGLLDQLVSAARALSDLSSRAEALSGIAAAVHAAGEKSRSVDIWREALKAARIDSRWKVFGTLDDGAPLLYDVDSGETLWSISEALREIEGWWAASTPQ
jgi:tetratricopeptide (TPR) repeat protein